MPVVLVVDDEPMIRTVLRECLERAGHAVVEAQNGVACVDVLHRHFIDLILLDIIMPTAEGIETILAIRREGREVPIIAMSGGGRTKGTDFLELAKKLGADETLQKPFRHKDVLSLVERLLGDRARKRALARR